MNKLLKTVLPAAAGAAAAAGLIVFAVAPGRSGKAQRAPFTGRNIAHRGLHKRDKSVPENSMAAFERAVESGYGIELDVHLTADGYLAVFHDDELERMCGVPGRIEDQTYEQLSRLILAGTEQRIPQLRQVLELVKGRVPIILEIKRGSRNKETCKKVYDALHGYKGAICVESFDPFIVRWWRRNAPEVLRGQLSCTARAFGGGTDRFTAFALSRLLTNFLGRPQFIAYGICDKKPWTVRLCERLGAMKVAWTSRNWENQEKNDTVIFEFYRPRTKYK